MKKSIFLLPLMSLFLHQSVAQDKMTDAETKMDAFTSKTGVIVKFIDYTLPGLNFSYGKADTKIRKIISGNESGYFYQIIAKGDYGKKGVSIAYSDLLEVIKALETLKSQSITDISSGSDYLENKFITEDDFEVGYFINKTKITWYIVLERRGSSSTLLVNDVTQIDRALFDAKNKIEQLQ